MSRRLRALNHGRPDRGSGLRRVVKLLEADGWRVIRQRGSHRQLRHATKPGLVTVSGTPGHELAAGTLHSVLKRAGLKA